MSSAPLALLVCLFLLDLDQFSGSSIGSRSILREVPSNGVGAVEYALELNATNFDAILSDSPASFSLVEFFAHWCPACRNYKPQYEKVARLFNGPAAVHPGIILMTRVDCALKINNKLCDRFSVSHYPMLFWGRPSKFVGVIWEPNKEKSEISMIDDGKTAERLLNWINKQIGSSYGLDDENFDNEHFPSNISEHEQIGRAVYDVEEATSTAFDIIIEHKMIRSKTRASFKKFLQLLVAHHPSRRCRMGSAEVLVNFDDLYPPEALSVDKSEIVGSDQKDSVGNIQICGKEVPRGYWMFCRGSKNDTLRFQLRIVGSPPFSICQSR
ncbi:hypothetical protein SAY86_002624 [Trapa natans]|uniref:Thioredoxin domain-containing protein n=1 Tax=Trapa natans TaxID=22666 RepID=A0AAN7LRB5_TRANT|nr:hypothetical protein SAY86_002624 [Trapa natans]